MAVLNEDPNLKKQRIGEKLKLVAAYQALNANPDFQLWKLTQVDVKLKRMEGGILHIDTRETGWEERLAGRVIAYQETKRAFESCFEGLDQKEIKLRKDLQEIKGDI